LIVVLCFDESFLALTRSLLGGGSTGGDATQQQSKCSIRFPVAYVLRIDAHQSLRQGTSHCLVTPILRTHVRVFLCVLLSQTPADQILELLVTHRHPSSYSRNHRHPRADLLASFPQMLDRCLVWYRRLSMRVETFLSRESSKEGRYLLASGLKA
jgi:hypothetical protein